MATVTSIRAVEPAFDTHTNTNQTSSPSFKPSALSPKKIHHSPSFSSPPSLGGTKNAGGSFLTPLSADSNKGLNRKNSVSQIPLTAAAVSYPTIVARSDGHSNFVPCGPAPTPTSKSNLTGKDLRESLYTPKEDDPSGAVILSVKRGSKTRPAPLKITPSNHTFLSPLFEKTGISNKLGFGSGKDAMSSSSERVTPPRSWSSRRASRLESNGSEPRATSADRPTSVSYPYADETRSTEAMLARAIESQGGQDLSRQNGITYPSGNTPNSAPAATTSPRVPVHTIPPPSAERVPAPQWPRMPSIALPTSVVTPPPPPLELRRPSATLHRRSASAEESSPQPLQRSTFGLPERSQLGSRPVTSYVPSISGSAPSQHPISTETSTTSHKAAHPPSVSPPVSATAEPNQLAALRGGRRSSSTTSSSGGSLLGTYNQDRRATVRVDDFASSKRRGSPPPPAGTSSSRRPSTAHAPQVPSAEHVSISLKAATPSAASREIARPALSNDGITLLLTSNHRPENLEVGWSCTSGIGEDGVPYSTYSLTLKPKALAPVRRRSSATSARNIQPVSRAAAAPNDVDSTKASLFSYRLSSESASDRSPSQSGPSDPGSPRSAPIPNSAKLPDGSDSVPAPQLSAGGDAASAIALEAPWLITPADAVLQRRNSAHPKVAPSPTKQRFDKYLMQQNGAACGALGLGFSLGPASVPAAAAQTMTRPFLADRSHSSFESDPRTPTRTRPSHISFPDPMGTRSRQDSIFVAGILGVPENDVDESLKMLSQIPTPNPQESSEDSEYDDSDEEGKIYGVTRKEERLVTARQRVRMMSKWSDTDGDEEEDENEIEASTPYSVGGSVGSEAPSPVVKA
ncbi:BQ5605_C017g08443 [Microbotryum silenes-dioicae]|uniref:BQ5605_C017g08443 protein n=1 Tax=Microbotryum silenes-dioicae TaxID=796604 RepID=A0A2X0NYY3_9BASI|nr:BQ5605_C017g08443 [Microbotryum silenes-dioicae]